MITPVSLGSKLKKLREDSGLNQSQIASFLGVDQSFISLCEKDQRRLNVELLERLCSLYGCTLPDLIEPGAPNTPLNFAFRGQAITAEDLTAISDIHRIALNIREMKKLLEAE
jgi:transcriptional regulator with XRE-family HTH domain